jgi:hypothetical protein
MEIKEIRKRVEMKLFGLKISLKVLERYQDFYKLLQRNVRLQRLTQTLTSERGDVPGWVLVVLMTTGLVTAIWTIAAPRLTSILKNSLDAMNGIR